MVAGQQLVALARQPLLHLQVSAARARPVPAGVVEDLLDVAVRARLDVAAQSRRPAPPDGLGGLVQEQGQPPGRQVLAEPGREDLAQVHAASFARHAL